MNDKQQLAAMGEHMREMEECNQQKHSATQVMAWAGDYEKEGGHGLIVEMLKSYAELLNSSQREPEFKVHDGWKLVPEVPSCEMVNSVKHLMSFSNPIGAYKLMLAASPEHKP